MTLPLILNWINSRGEHLRSRGVWRFGMNGELRVFPANQAPLVAPMCVLTAACDRSPADRGGSFRSLAVDAGLPEAAARLVKDASDRTHHAGHPRWITVEFIRAALISELALHPDNMRRLLA